VFSGTTTWVFRAGPIVGFVTAALAALLVPLGARGATVSFAGDMISFVYLFGLGRFFTVAAALDTGSAFEGMGGAREATFSCLAEPAFVLALLVPAAGAKTLSLSLIDNVALRAEWSQAPAPLVLILVSMFIVLLAENCR